MRILCATDLLPRSDAAIERAGLLADQLEAQLTLLHVVVPGGSPVALEETLQWAAAELRARSLPPRWRERRVPDVTVRAGPAAPGILDTAASLRAGLLVLGPHRKRPLYDALEGTIAEKALSARNCAVLVAQKFPTAPYRHVLLALDSSDPSAAAIRAAESLVLAPEVQATVVHAHKAPYEGLLYSADVGVDAVARYAANWNREAHREVRELLHLESDHAGRYHIHVEQRPAAPAILQAVERFTPDLLVMGTRGASRLRRTLVGSVATQVLRESDCDVLIVPEGSFGPPRSRRLLGGRRRPRIGTQEGVAGDALTA
jgi:nucleotide-binding universal stress UspA family protein